MHGAADGWSCGWVERRKDSNLILFCKNFILNKNFFNNAFRNAAFQPCNSGFTYFS
jgi:hypothetical protein